MCFINSCNKDQGPADSKQSLQPPPATWQEHWLGHNQLLTCVYSDADVAVYYDKDMNRSVIWPFKYMGDVWRYVKSVYGDFGKDPRLYAVFHQGKYQGGSLQDHFDGDSEGRDITDVGADDWTNPSGWNLDASTHEVGHIVEGSSHYAHESPAFTIWGDSKWNEIFIYDVYVGLGKTSDSARWYNSMMASSHYDDFPRANTHWFRDWFYPIWKDYGKSAVLNNFFDLLSKNFPKYGYTYTRDMNWGEFVHFWSGAAGINLKGRAKIAFGWSPEWESLFIQAQSDFPNVTYR